MSERKAPPPPGPPPDDYRYNAQLPRLETPRADRMGEDPYRSHGYPGPTQLHVPNPAYYPPSPQPIISQPSAVSSAQVVINQRGGRDDRPRAWNAGLYGCCDDCCTCFAVLFCTSCFLCWLSDKMGETLCMPLFVPCAPMALRIRLRAEENIQGSILGDCCTTCCCYECVLCQLKRELDYVATARMMK